MTAVSLEEGLEHIIQYWQRSDNHFEKVIADARKVFQTWLEEPGASFEDFALRIPTTSFIVRVFYEGTSQEVGEICSFTLFRILEFLGMDPTRIYFSNGPTHVIEGLNSSALEELWDKYKKSKEK